MKVNEVPKKIILSVDRETGKLYNEWVIKDLTDNIKIEYIRTDAFIEKTEKWIDNFLSESTLIDYKVTPIVRNAVIENFKNYIKGE